MNQFCELVSPDILEKSLKLDKNISINGTEFTTVKKAFRIKVSEIFKKLR